MKEKKILKLLAAAVLVLFASAAAAHWGARSAATPYYDLQLEAAKRLEGYFSAVRGYKEDRGIAISGDDIHKTGLIGQPYTEITTTSGALEAKRTAAWPDMAALCVRMLHEAGVKAGDTVGAGFSGSFPGMNLAVVAACETMGVDLICISSVGASTYGANDPELTFPEMLQLLKEDGLVETESVAVTMGGYRDVGADMEPQTAAQIKERLREAGLHLVEEEDFSANLEYREGLYESLGPIRCFIAVGGNLTSLGGGEEGASLGQGVLYPGASLRLQETSGLVQRYLARGIPVINLLNLKKIMADYSMPYDPAVWPAAGTSAVYSTTEYPAEWILAGLAGSAVLLGICLYIRRKPPTIGREEKGKGE